MSFKIKKNTNPRAVVRFHKKSRIKKRAAAQRGKSARLVVYKSNTGLYAQLVDDLKGITLVQANTREDHFKSFASKKNLEVAKELGKRIGQKTLELKVSKVYFDRNGYNYHGRIKAIAEGAREVGLEF